DVDETQRGGLVVHASAQADHVGVVVFARQPRGVVAERQRATDAADLVGCHRFTVAAAAEDDAEAAGLGGHAYRRRDHECRIVVFRVVRMGAAVDRIVALRGQMVDEPLLQLEAGVVRTQIDAHGSAVFPTWVSPASTAAKAAGSPPSRQTKRSSGAGREVFERCTTTGPWKRSRWTSRSDCRTPALVHATSKLADCSAPGVRAFSPRRLALSSTRSRIRRHGPP